MAKPYCYKYPMLAVTVDCVVFSIGGMENPRLKVLLIQRENEPFADSWALPGTYVHIEEGLEEAALRGLRSKAGLTDVYLEQLYSFGEPGRDPRGRVLSCAYYALAKPQQAQAAEGSRSREARWFDAGELPELAFDHATILTKGLERLRGKLCYEPVGMELLQEPFTLPELRAVYEAILGRAVDRGNFRKAILHTGLLKQGEVRRSSNAGGRPPILYQFDKKTYARLKKSGITLDLSL